MHSGKSGVAQQDSGGKPHMVVAKTQLVSAVVEDIDQEKRMITLKRSDGRLFRFRVDERVRRLDQVKKGDRVRVGYYSSASIMVRKSEGEPLSQSEKVEVIPSSHALSGVLVNAASAVAIVTGIDYRKRIAKVKTPDGEIVTVHATPEMTRFDEVKTGDRVVVDVTEAVAVSVHK